MNEMAASPRGLLGEAPSNLRALRRASKFRNLAGLPPGEQFQYRENSLQGGRLYGVREAA
jgi:hypothetical protein